MALAATFVPVGVLFISVTTPGIKGPARRSRLENRDKRDFLTGTKVISQPGQIKHSVVVKPFTGEDDVAGGNRPPARTAAGLSRVHRADETAKTLMSVAPVARACRRPKP